MAVREAEKGQCHGHFKKCKEDHPGNYWPISLTSVPKQIMELVFLEAMSKHTKDRKVTGNSQHGGTMGRLCLTSLTTFCGEQMKGMQWVMFIL